MKCRIYGKFLTFTEFTVQEIQWIENKLTWGEKFDAQKETLLFFSKEYGHHTYAGLYYPLSKCTPFLLELENPPPIPEPLNIQISPHLLLNIELLDFQRASIQKALTYKKGIVCSPTGSGKTEQLLGLLKYLLQYQNLQRGLIVVPSVGLALQLYERALLRGIHSSQISIAMGGLKEVKATPLIVGVINTLDNVLQGPPRGLKNFILGAQLLIFDEGHRGSASRYVNLALATQPQYLLYYSASPFREKDIWENCSDALLYGLAGRVIFDVPQQYIRNLGLIAEPVIYFKPIPGKESKARSRYDTVYDKYVVNHSERNQVIVQYASKFARLKFPVLILVQRKEHAVLLMHALKEYQVISVFGASTCLQFDDEKQLHELSIDYNHFRSEFERGAYQIVIASQVMDEGFDCPGIGAVILAGGGKSRIKLLQRLGRGLRKKKTGKNCVYILDFYDRTHVFLLNHSKKRIDLFKEVDATFPQNEFTFLQQIINHAQELRAL